MYKVFSTIILICWMGLIFYFSHQPVNVSSELSEGITETIVTNLETVAPNIGDNLTNHIIRKNAHFFIFLILGMLMMNAFSAWGVKGLKRIGAAILLCVIYAITDEVHQLFVLGRGGQVRDVLIDSAGACVGIGVYMLINKLVFPRFQVNNVRRN